MIMIMIKIMIAMQFKRKKNPCKNWARPHFRMKHKQKMEMRKIN